MPASDLGSYDWHGQVAGIINRIGDQSLPGILVAALADLVPFDHTAIIGHHKSGRPRNLFAAQERLGCHAKYFAGNYRLDPFYRAAVNGMPSGLYRMADIDSDITDYLERYELGPPVTDVLKGRKSQSDLGSGEDLREEVSYVFSVNGSRFLHLALIRSKARPGFSDDEFARLQTIEPVIRAAAERHWWDQDLRGDSAFGALTEREIQIVREILRGCRTEAIGLRLGISPGTVKVHRKNIYRKLGISSQGELFALGFDPALRQH